MDVHGAVIETRYDELVARLRPAAQPGRAAPAAAAAYLEQVRVSARTITDADLDALRAAGLSEDEIFEQTVAVAVEAGLERLDAALRVLR